jgi:hypothetical protein
MISYFNALLGSGFSIPDGTPTLTLVGTKFIATTDGNAGDNDGWYGRPSPVTRWSPGRNRWETIMSYKEGAAHHLERYGIIHFRISLDYGATWSDEDKTPEGDAIVGAPTRPNGAGNPSGNNRGPSHGILTLCPNGYILCHMWSSDYTGTDSTTNNDGGHQVRSTDGGYTWGAAARQTILNYAGSPNRTFFGEGRTVVGDTIWMIIRDCRADGVTAPDFYYTEQMHLAKSEDNGTTWTWVSAITTFTEPGGSGSCEASLEYLGDGRFISLLRPGGVPGPNYHDGWITWSDDMGETWSTPLEITAALGLPSNFILGRTIVKTRAHMKLQNNWWRDRVIIVCGFTSEGGVSTGTRRNIAWAGIIPADYNYANIVWSAPCYPDDAGYDGGYGDFIWDPINEQIVYCSYRGPSSYYDSSVKQYNMTLTFV